MAWDEAVKNAAVALNGTICGGGYMKNADKDFAHSNFYFEPMEV